MDSTVKFGFIKCLFKCRNPLLIGYILVLKFQFFYLKFRYFRLKLSNIFLNYRLGRLERQLGRLERRSKKVFVTQHKK